MESVVAQGHATAHSSISVNHFRATLDYQTLIVQSPFVPNDDAAPISSLTGIQPLPLTAREIIKKINEQLKTTLPKGVESLKPEEATPEATAGRIVSQITALYENYAKQNSHLGNEEIVSSFMDKVRSGVAKGYDEAYAFLEGLGAFSFEGVEDGIKKTKTLIEEKLQQFEAQKRESLGLPVGGAAAEASSQSSVATGILGQAGAGLLNVVA